MTKPFAPLGARTSGFTLVEIMVVILLLGVVAAAVAPGLLGPTDRGDAQRSAEELLSMLRTARRTAVAEGLPVALTLDPATGRYWVTTDRGTGHDQNLAEGELTLAAGVRLLARDPRPRFMFQPVGVASGDPVVVQGRDGQVVVAVDPWTGDARVATR
jgi:type II secretion system protein H